MGRFRFAGVAALIGALFICANVAAAVSPQLNEAMSFDGLKKTTIKGVDLAYVRPGVTLKGYTSVELAPVFVSFYKNWNPDVPGEPWKLSSSQREDIKTRAAKLVHDSFVKELEKGGGFQVVSEPGPHVLLLKLNIINLYVTNPGVMTAGMSETFSSQSPGQATLYAEFYDSESGQILARVIDTQAAQNSYGMSFSNSVTNYAAGQQVADQWAKILRDRLDKARDAMATPAAATAQ